MTRCWVFITPEVYSLKVSQRRRFHVSADESDRSEEAAERKQKEGRTNGVSVWVLLSLRTYGLRLKRCSRFSVDVGGI